MRHPSPRSSQPAPLPSLTEVQRNPAILTGLSLTALVDLRRQISHLLAALDAVFCQAMTQARTLDPPAAAAPDRLLTPEVAAARFGVTRR